MVNIIFDFLLEAVLAAWGMLVDSAFLFLIGLILAGLISAFLKPDRLLKLVGKGKVSSVLRASLYGVPLPLCSCSVLPVAEQMKKNGMKKGPLTSFLISTPETGVDSVILTYSLINPVIAVIRPISAFITAFFAGIFQTEDVNELSEKNQSTKTCGCHDESIKDENNKLSVIEKLFGGIRYAFTSLISDLAPYLVVGFLLAGIVEASMGDISKSLSETYRSGVFAYLGAIIIGLPLYICATSSTPFAASLINSGFSPGAIIVFLLVGPATNMTALVVLKRILGLKSTLRYLLAIIIVAVMCGLLTDLFYDAASDKFISGELAHGHTQSMYEVISAILLTIIILFWSGKKAYRRVSDIFIGNIK